MSILVVGSVAFDSIETPHGKVDHILGGAATHFALAASYFTDVRVIAVVGEDFTTEHEAVFTKRGIDTRRWWETGASLIVKEQQISGAGQALRDQMSIVLP